MVARSRSGFYQSRDGSERLWFSSEDIELMTEGELQKAKLLPSVEEPAVDVQRFIGRYLKVRMDEHATLESSVLGLTEFYRDGLPKILINKDLTDAVDDDDTPPGLHGRWRATMAHEASHVVMHRILFMVEGDQEQLFRTGPPQQETQRLMRCFKKNVFFRSGGSDWREVQANLGMAALLMPRRVFRLVATAAVARLGLRPEDLIVGSSAVAALASDVSRSCEVSKQAASIRLETVGMVSPPGQRVVLGVR